MSAPARPPEGNADISQGGALDDAVAPLSADRRRLAVALTTAIARGLLPPEATVPVAPTTASRPWPLLLLSALGAWLVALPMFSLVAPLLGPLLQSGPGLAVAGAGILIGAATVLRQPTPTPFVEQLAVAGLLVGSATASIGLSMAGAPMGLVAALMLLVALGVAAAVPQGWLQVLCGMSAAGSALVAATLALQTVIAEGGRPAPDDLRSALSLHALLWLGWGLPVWLRGRLDRPGCTWLAERIEPVAAGWQATALCGWAAFAVWDVMGQSTTASATMRGVFGALSVVSTLAAAALLRRAWPALRRPWLVAVAVAPLALAWAAPATGPVLLSLALALTTHRQGRAALAGLVLVGVALGFFWSLSWPLADKALLLAGCGLWLALGAAWGWRADRAVATAAPTDFAPTERFDGADSTRRAPSIARMGPTHDSARAAPRWTAWAGVACAVTTLLVVNLGIRDKQALIARGQPVFVELAPVDPRSLMQGDYMALRYRYAPELSAQLEAHDRFDRPRARARVDARGVALLQRLDDATPRAADERVIELTPKGGRWTVVSDAWFFREGEGARWQAARYGEFRVDAKGRALLVGMVDADLRPIRPAPPQPAVSRP